MRFSILTATEEKEYIKEKLREGRFSLRLFFVAFIILYGAFGYLDSLLAGEYASILIFIRFGVVIPYFLLVIAFTYHKAFSQWGQQMLFGSFVLAGVGISYMLILLPDTFSYYGGAFMIIFSGYFLLKLNTGYAVVGGLTNLMIFIGGYAMMNGEIPFHVWLMICFFFGSNVIGVIGNYQIEKNRRILYRQEREIKEKNHKLEVLVNEQRKDLVQVEKAIESTSDAIAIYSPEGILTYANQAYKNLTDSSRTFAESLFKNREAFFKKTTEEGSWKKEQIITKNDGNAIVMLLQVDIIKQADGIIIGFVTTYKDITERKDAEKEVIYLSFHDGLTGLYNRRFFDEELKRINVYRNLPLTLVMLDVNGLKLTNDAFGHRVGDELLVKVANVLKETCRADDVIARIGGDEFVVLLPHTNKDQARQIITRIKQAVALEKLEDLPISISVSCGFGIKKKEQQNINEVFKKAEDDMYRSKISHSRSYRHQTIDLIMETLYVKSPREQAHSKRVSKLCEAIGLAMGLETQELTTVGMLHDIGKVSISESILEKKAPLTDSEWKKIKKHPEAGYSILSSSPDYGLLAECVLAHHEHWDGTGYPNGLEGDAIPLMARIIAIADAYDAMVSDRPYRNGMKHVDAMKEIKRCAASQFDPYIVKVFVDLMEKQHLAIIQTERSN